LGRSTAAAMCGFPRALTLLALASSFAFTLASAGGLRGSGESWDYRGFHVGDWPDKGFPLCAGRPAGPGSPHNEWQAPIDIPTEVTDRDTDTLILTGRDGGCSSVDMEHDGHTWQASFERVNCSRLTASWHGRNYTLLQLHFHLESENMLGGHHKDMEVHLVHRAEDGSLLVIGVLLERSDLPESGLSQENGFLGTLFRVGFSLHQVMDQPLMNPYSGLMSQGQEFYTYLGSLTTPPCTPNIEWIVMRDPVPIKRQSIEEFEGYLKRASQSDSYGHVDRPVQPLNGRPVKIGTIAEIAA